MFTDLLFLKKNINIMDLQTVSTCVNCENLSKNFVCGKHNLNVGELSMPFKSVFGYHLVLLVDRVGEKIKSKHI